MKASELIKFLNSIDQDSDISQINAGFDDDNKGILIFTADGSVISDYKD